MCTMCCICGFVNSSVICTIVSSIVFVFDDEYGVRGGAFYGFGIRILEQSSFSWNLVEILGDQNGSLLLFEVFLRHSDSRFFK